MASSFASRSVVTAQVLPPFARPALPEGSRTGVLVDSGTSLTESSPPSGDAAYSVEEANPFRFIGTGAQWVGYSGCDGASGVHWATVARWGMGISPSRLRDMARPEGKLQGNPQGPRRDAA
jgi:hypothetical protein